MNEQTKRASVLTAVFVLLVLLTAACSVPPERAAMFPTVTNTATAPLESPATAVPSPTLAAATGSSVSPVPPPVDSPPTAGPEIVDDPRAPQLQAYLDGIAASGQFMGSVLVADKGTILIDDGFGFADVAAGRPNTSLTQLRIGSLTKQFTAAAILRLQEMGLLDVRDPVSQYLPDFPEGDRITIQQLLTHTSGVANYTERPDLQQVVQTPTTLDTLIDQIAGRPLQFEPGQRYAYSDSGYVILTKIIEEASGQPYASFLQTEFFDPLGMSRSGYDFLDPGLEERAVGYRVTPGGPQPAIDTDSSWPSGAGALYSTTGDLYLWDRALYGSTLDENSRAAMFKPWTPTDQDFSYGYGWEIGNTAGRPSQAHAGVIFGFGSFIARFPQDDAVIIVLGNGLQMPPRRIATDLAQILFASGAPE